MPLSVRTKSVSSRLTQAVAQALLQRGIGPRELEARTGVKPTWLTEPEGRVPAAHHMACMNLLWEQPMPSDILHLPLSMGLQPWPVLAALLLNAPTLAEALACWTRYRRLIGDPDDLTIRRDGAFWSLELQLDGAPARSTACAYFPLAMVLELLALHLPGEHRICAFQLAGLPFMNERALQERHTGLLSFGHQRHRLVVHAPGAEAPLRQHNPHVHRFFRVQADAALQRLDARHSWSSRLAIWLEQAMADEAVGAGVVDPANLLEAAAARWQLKPRTLQRRLQLEGESFQAVLGRARLQEARRLLSEGEHSLTEIGERLGFSASSAFTRFFTREQGMPPSQFRTAMADRVQIRAGCRGARSGRATGPLEDFQAATAGDCAGTEEA